MSDISFYIPKDETIPTDLKLYVGNMYVKYERVENGFYFHINTQTIEGRKTGRWILVKGSNGKDYHKCSRCLHTQDITGVKNYCAVCGAEMEATHENS